MENAPSLLPTTPSLLIQDAESGTGTIKFASNAQTDGFSTATKSVFQ
jgi:hypothetical protein